MRFVPRPAHLTRRDRPTTPRRGTSLPELLVALVVLGFIGVACVRLLISQTTFYDVQLKKRAARTVSRASVNLMLSELRMIESTGGVEAATPTSVTLRVPYAMGMACATVGTVSVISLLPTDSTVLAAATPSGHGWRDNYGNYTYANGSVSTVAGGASLCSGANITPVPGGRVISMSPPLPTGANAGDAVLLYQRVRYEFANSSVLPGRRALWRTVVDTDTREELAAPFDISARFRFFQFDRDTSDATATASDIQGLELVLDGESQFARAGASSAERSPFRTSVFFNNRVN